jgi:hypothetical protein
MRVSVIPPVLDTEGRILYPLVFVRQRGKEVTFRVVGKSVDFESLHPVQQEAYLEGRVTCL